MNRNPAFFPPAGPDFRAGHCGLVAERLSVPSKPKAAPHHGPPGGPALPALLLFFFLAALPAPAADFFIAPDGRDANAGTEAKPFATLTRARDAVRSAQTATHARPRSYAVAIRGGLYRVSETIVFSLADSAADGHTITYAAHANEKPIFTTTRAITDWRQDGTRWTAALPAGTKPFLTLNDAAGRLPRARGPAFSPTRDYRTVEGLDKSTLAFPPGALKAWPDLADAEIVVRPNFGWVLDILPLESVDEATGLARTRIPASYLMIKVRWGLRDVNTKGTVWVENVRDVLDEPGE